jgi:hypothetical protein
MQLSPARKPSGLTTPTSSDVRERRGVGLKKWIKGIRWLSVTDSIWNNAAEMAFALRRKGITMSAIDTLIAALAIEYDCCLLHRDSHFDLVARHCELKCYSL